MINSELFIDYLLEDGREIGRDLGLECGGQAVPDVSWMDWHSPSLCVASVTNSWTAWAVSFVGAAGRDGARVVAATGSRKSICWRYATKTYPVPWGEKVRETTGNRRPNNGWVGSLTEISLNSAGSGFWKGISC